MERNVIILVSFIMLSALGMLYLGARYSLQQVQQPVNPPVEAPVEPQATTTAEAATPEPLLNTSFTIQ
jgi:hypothetical protein